MKICVVGTGYVGLVAGACFADSGNDVICVDCDRRKIDDLNAGKVPIYEPGLSELVQTNARARRLAFTTDLAEAARRSRIIVLAVGTPASNNGAADVRALMGVADEVAKAMDGYRVIVVKSTVPVGTYVRVTERIRAHTKHPFDYVSNPEFMKEGAAIEDFTKPDRIVLGVAHEEVIPLMRQLYAPFMRRTECLLTMDPASAELTKYAANAMLAARISFMNELAGLCERLGADVEAVRHGVGSDRRIGPAFLYPGVGFGGSCFPKDVSALISMGEAVDYPMSVTAAVREVNLRQRRRFAERVVRHFGGSGSGVTLAVWGLAFKARTDDVRESPAIDGVRLFAESGFQVAAYDPEAMETARAELGGGVRMAADQYEALDGADALVLFTDWPQFRAPDFDEMAGRLSRKIVFDGRNMYDPKLMAERGFHYECIGRPFRPPSA